MRARSCCGCRAGRDTAFLLPGAHPSRCAHLTVARPVPRRFCVCFADAACGSPAGCPGRYPCHSTSGSTALLSNPFRLHLPLQPRGRNRQRHPVFLDAGTDKEPARSPGVLHLSDVQITKSEGHIYILPCWAVGRSCLAAQCMKVMGG